MKTNKLMPILLSVCLAMPTTSIMAYADGNPSEDTIVSEIWSDWWIGKEDDGKTFPEASYKHHILGEWIDTNYGNDDYEWSDTGELYYSFMDYYDELTDNWDFNDDDSGNWTIDTNTTTYHFDYENGEWLMIDSNGNTVDSFQPFSTLEEQDAGISDSQSNSNNQVKGNLPQNGSVTTDSKASRETTPVVVESHTEASESHSNSLFYVIGILILAGLGAIGILLYKRNKK